MDSRLQKAKNVTLNNFEFADDEDFKRIVGFCNNTQMAIKILGKIVHLLPELRGPRDDEEEKS